MSEKYEAERNLVAVITSVLTDHPDLAGTAAQAIGAGVARGVERLQREANETRLALSLSLALIGANRMTPASRAMLEAQIASVIGPVGICSAEREFLARPSKEEPA